MGFKADTSFLQKLTMGATAARAAIGFLSGMGFQPIELERYCTSNKIWMTKVKRLRLADILCCKTGLRMEVRGKSDLRIKMSDSPKNPHRRWDSGLRDDDFIALVPCQGGTQVRVRGAPIVFAVRDLRSTAHLAKLGPPKSASEGAERDLTWPSIVPTDDGEVLSVAPDRIRVRMRTGREQTYRLNGKNSHVTSGTTFAGEASILASVVPRTIDPVGLLERKWDPLGDLRSREPADRYAAAKALAYRQDLPHRAVIEILRGALDSEPEMRTALEIAGTLARLGVDHGYEYLALATRRGDEDAPPYLRMEAVLILSELPDQRSADILDDIASDERYVRDELRQAAVWGMGKNGIRAFERLAPYVGDKDDDVALHAIVGLGDSASSEAVEWLSRRLIEPGPARVQAAVSEALRLIGTRAVAERLVTLSASKDAPWLIATLGRIPQSVLSDIAMPEKLRKAIEPVALLSPPGNWIEMPTTATDFQFLLQQDL